MAATNGDLWWSARHPEQQLPCGDPPWGIPVTRRRGIGAERACVGEQSRRGMTTVRVTSRHIHSTESGERTMKRVLLGLAVVALAAAANASLPQRAKADPPTGSWAYVCCGAECTIGDVCSGTGTYTCCK